MSFILDLEGSIKNGVLASHHTKFWFCHGSIMTGINAINCASTFLPTSHLCFTSYLVGRLCVTIVTSACKECEGHSFSLHKKLLNCSVLHEQLEVCNETRLTKFNCSEMLHKAKCFSSQIFFSPFRVFHFNLLKAIR